MPALPFLQNALVTRNGEEVVTGMPISIWPAGVRAGDIGGVYDHEGEAPIAFYLTLNKANTRIAVDERAFTVIDAQLQQFVPHVSLLLREIQPGGI